MMKGIFVKERTFELSSLRQWLKWVLSRIQKILPRLPLRGDPGRHEQQERKEGRDNGFDPLPQHANGTTIILNEDWLLQTVLASRLKKSPSSALYVSPLAPHWRMQELWKASFLQIREPDAGEGRSLEWFRAQDLRVLDALCP